MSPALPDRLLGALLAPGEEATVALAAVAWQASEAVRLLSHRIAVDQAFPLEREVPYAQTRQAMAEVDEMVSTCKARLTSTDELFAETCEYLRFEVVLIS